MIARTRPVVLGALTALAMTVVACGSSPAETNAGNAGAGAQSETTTISGRPGAGIAAAFNPVTSGSPCPPTHELDSPDTVKIAWVQPDLDELAAVGLETLDLDPPALVVDAYVNQLNSQGGINGSCFELITYQWSLSTSQEDIEQICADVPQRDPLALLALRFNRNLLDCLTHTAKIPTMSFYSSFQDSALSQGTEGEGLEAAYWLIVDSALARVPENLYLDQPATREIFTHTLDTSISAGHLSPDNKIGLLIPPADADSEGGSGSDDALIGWFLNLIADERGLEIVYEATVPAEFQSTEVQIAENRARALRFDLSEDEAQEAADEFRVLSVEDAELLVRMEDYWTSTVDDFQIAGVDTVIVAADWTNLRRMMRAADAANWTPTWIINDLQPVPLVLIDTPERQGHNLLQISASRAAGDDIPQLDQDCITMRNTAPDSPAFSHRVHTDAWNLATLTCDYMDVLFGAAGQVEGALTREALISVLDQTVYDTPHGSLIRFTPDDHVGSDRYRVLKADPTCILNDWGCMRPISDWIAVSTDAADEGG